MKLVTDSTRIHQITCQTNSIEIEQKLRTDILLNQLIPDPPTIDTCLDTQSGMYYFIFQYIIFSFAFFLRAK